MSELLVARSQVVGTSLPTGLLLARTHALQTVHGMAIGVADAAAGVKGFGLKLLLRLNDKLGSLAATYLIYAF